MLFSEIISVLDVKNTVSSNLDIKNIVYDSRHADEDSCFVCLKGHSSDGHDYALSAYTKGCRAFVAQDKLKLPDDSVVVYVDDTRKSLALMSAEFFGHPERRLKLVGITGTKGKTTVTALVREILNAANIPCASIGTNGIYLKGKIIPTVNTTPESYELFKAFSTMLEEDISVCVCEVSSQAYLLDRVFGITFDIGVFTNLAADHIGDGEHPNFENYLECKKMLFKNCRIGIFNLDDEHYTSMVKDAACMSTTYAIHNHADISADYIKPFKTENSLGTSFECSCFGNKFSVSMKMPGEFNVSNALAAVSVSKRFGVSDDIISKSLAHAAVRGRFEVIDVLDYATFIIDYAHNGFAMQNLLETVRKYSPQRLVVLYGSVGSRTEMRRRELGEVCSKYADFSIITSDNPDFEDPEKIISEIAESYENNTARFIAVPDREKAIEYAVKHALVGDVVILAGKGHENYQLVEGKRIPFDEREILLSYSAMMKQK